MLIPILLYSLVDHALRLDVLPVKLHPQEIIASGSNKNFDYPYYQLLRSNTNQEVPLISGKIVLPSTRVEMMDYLYVPYFSGRLSVLLNGRSIFDSADKIVVPPLNKYQSALIPMPNFKEGEKNTIEVALYKSSRIFGALSNIYIGSNSHFDHAATIRMAITEKVPINLWGVTSLALASLFFISLTSRSISELAPLLIISLFLFCTTTTTIFSNYLGIGSLQKYILNFSILLVVSVHYFQKTLLQDSALNSKGAWCAAGVASVALLVLSILQPNSTHLINLFVNAPIIIFGLFGTMIQSSYKFIRSGNSDSLFLSAGLFSVLVSFGHDILIRFGFFKEGVFLVTLGLTIFFVVLVIIFSNTVFQMRSDLQNQKEILKRKLAARESALLMEKDKHIALARNSAILNENARLTRDLHDGVLTYLSMIQALSENKGNQDKKLISRIARYASQEIRLILESGSEQDREILLMLATFRQQVVEPMVGQKKILVNWNIANLVDQKMTSNSSSLNLFRILQETFHNAYERAGCTYIHVWSELHDPNIIKIIIENTGGSTFNPECRYGNGIKNMVRRARLIGATFDIQPIFSGARVVITLTRLQTH